MSIQGVVVGLLLGLGLVLTVRRLPVFRRPRLIDRLAPYLRDAAVVPSIRPDHDRTVTPFPTFERILRPYARQGARALERVLGGSAAIRRRLRQAGLDLSTEQFRVEQLLWGGIGFVAAVAISILLLLGRGGNPVPLVVFCGVVFVLGVMLRDRHLATQVRQREARMIQEFPTVADMLALAVTAGEGPISALERVTRLSGGELAREFQLALADARTGASLVQALERMGDRTGLPALARFVDGVAVAVERGTPLAEVLHAQAADVRELSKRTLIEAGGRKEIAMMVPVVFLVLPVTIVFAFYPGLIGLSIIAP